MQSLGRLGLVALASAILVCAAAVSWWTRGDSPLAYLPADGPGEWIVYPLAPRTETRPVTALEATFHRTFQLERAPERARLDLRVLGSGTVEINGRTALESSSKKRVEHDVTPALRSGSNTIVARVSHDSGPPALNLTLALDDGRQVATDTRWRASLAGAAWRNARAARDLAGPAASVPKHAPGWLLAFGGAAALLVALAVRIGPARQWPPRAAVAMAAVLWLALLANSASHYPHLVGFDVHHHMAYVRYVLERGALPLPSDGPLMYHPPLFYAMCAGLARLLELDLTQASASAALRGLTCALGIAHVAALYGCVRRLLPGRAQAHALALVFAACLPMHLYLFSYLTNETLAAALGTASVYLLIRILHAPRPRFGAYVALGLCLGCALLAKVSTLLLVPLAAAALVASHPRRWAHALLALGIAAALSGWHYARIAWAFGNPLIGNWDPELGFAWWQDPGYRTASQYWRFGRVLADPWYAGFYSIPDGLYSTFWGDGLAGGATSRLTGPSWNAGLMRQGYWLAAVPSLALAIGAARGIGAGLRRPSARNLFLFALALGTAMAMLYMTLRIPSYAQAKAFYAHLALVPVCAAFALGADWILRRRRPIGPIFAWALLLWAINAYASFWIANGAPETLLQDGEKALVAGSLERARADFERVLQSEPDRAQAFVGLCRLQARRGDWTAARAACETALELQPEDPEALYHGARVDVAQGRRDRALATLQRLRERGLGDARVLDGLVYLLARRGDDEAAAAAAREWLRFAPGDSRAQTIARSAGVDPLAAEDPPSGP